MQVCLVLHVRRLPDSSGVVVTSVDFPRLRAEGPDLDHAVARLRPDLVAAVQALDPFDHGTLIAAPVARLLRVPVTIPATKRNPVELALTVGVVVSERDHADGQAYLVRVPGAPGFEFVTTSREDIEPRVAELLPGSVKRWRASSILAVDESDDSYVDLLVLDEPGGEQPSSPDPGILAERGLDLTARAREGAIGRLDGRDDLVRRLLLALADPERSSVLLVGPHAVGKTALVHEAAARIAAGDVPASLKDAALWRLSANELIAGAQYTGMWQDRAKMLIDALRGGPAICFMDDPMPILDAGRWSQSDNNVSRFLRPYMESGDISIICETTAEGLAAVRLKEPSFVEAFHRIDVPEPSLELTRSLCAAVAERLGTASGIAVVQDAVEAAVELTRRFEPYRAFPGKAIAALEETVRESPDDTGELHRPQVTAVFAARTGLPVALIADEMQLQTKDVRTHFATRVLGQEQATEAMVELITVIKAGLASPDRPLGSFLFVGPTGVGKTELAKALAEYLFGSKERVLRLDMGEYTAGDAVAKLLGSGWQHEDEGELTRRIREQPFSVVLLDEIEKANPPVFDALLSALGEGRLTNAAGVTADFRNAIVIMTSNLGATRSQSGTLGFGASSGDDATRHYVEEAERFFRPEFFNRIGRIVPFRPLGEETIRQIARRELGRLLLLEGITRRKLLVEVDDPVIEVLGREGFHPRYGARPLQRAIERAVIEPARPARGRPVAGAGEISPACSLPGRGDRGRAHAVEEPAATAAKPRPRARSGSGTFARAVRAARSSRRCSRARTQPRPSRSCARSTHGSSRPRTTRASGTSPTKRPADALAPLPDRARARPVRQPRRRAEGLVGFARDAAALRSRPRLREVWEALDEMDDGLAATRLELAGAVFDASHGLAVGPRRPDRRGERRVGGRARRDVRGVGRQDRPRARARRRADDPDRGPLDVRPPARGGRDPPPHVRRPRARARARDRARRRHRRRRRRSRVRRPRLRGRQAPRRARPADGRPPVAPDRRPRRGQDRRVPPGRAPGYRAEVDLARRHELRRPAGAGGPRVGEPGPLDLDADERRRGASRRPRSRPVRVSSTRPAALREGGDPVLEIDARRAARGPANGGRAVSARTL